LAFGRVGQRFHHAVPDLTPHARERVILEEVEEPRQLRIAGYGALAVMSYGGLDVWLVVVPLFEPATHGFCEQIDVRAAVSLLVLDGSEDSRDVSLPRALSCPYGAKSNALDLRFTNQELVDPASNLTGEPVQERSCWRTLQHVELEPLRDGLLYGRINLSNELPHPLAQIGGSVWD
jgi:hypothetical protein